MNPIETLRTSLASLQTRDAEFARSLVTQFDDRGSLSDKQWPWVHKLIERAAEARAPKPQSDALRLPNIAGLMRHACEHAKRVKITMRQFSVRSSRYADVFYICAGETYIGKILPDMTFSAAKNYEAVKAWQACRDELLTLELDPLAAAVAYGHETGECCFCARELTDARSVRVGYGPICARRFGLPWGEKETSEPTLSLTD